MKTSPRPGITANFSAYNTDVKDYQTTVFGGVGALRGYLANAEKVRVRGVEFDGSAARARSSRSTEPPPMPTVRTSSSPDAPAALEDTGGPQFVDISGSRLAGLSKWAFSLGGEYVTFGGVGREGDLRGVRHDVSVGVLVQSDTSDYLVIDGYSLVNARIGLRRSNGWSVSVWARNLLNKNYYEMLSASGREHRDLCRVPWGSSDGRRDRALTPVWR